MAYAASLVRALIFGWAALIAFAFLERPLLNWIAPMAGEEWAATLHLFLDCAAMAAAGWCAGRFSRPRPMRAALLFALTLCGWDFGGMLALNVPWLLRLARDAFENARYLDSLIASAEMHLILFGCLMGGAALSRPGDTPPRIVSS